MTRHILVLVALLLVAAPVVADEPADGWSLNLSGYIQERYDHEEGEVSNDRTRLRFGVEWSDAPCGVYGELDLSGAQDSMRGLQESNWLQKAWVGCRTGRATVDIGRVFPESGFSTFWPGGIITARYPGMYPWEGYYAYGVSVKVPHGVWAYSGTVSGRSDLQFDDSGQFDRVEVAGRAKGSFGESGHLGLAFQASDDFFIGGVDARRVVGKTTIDSGVFYSSEANTVSAFVQAERRLNTTVAFHALLEEQADGEEVATVGVGLRRWGFYLVGDYEKNFDADDTVLIGLRYNW